MNTYQKVIVCVFRSIGLLGFGYMLVSLGVTAFMMPDMLRMSLPMMLPLLVPSLVLAISAVPLAKLVTIGLENEE